MNKPKRLARRVICQTRWVNHYIDRVELPGGRIAEEHHFLDFPRQAAAAVVENEAGDILLARVYRYVIDSVEWEIPGGAIDDGESPIEAARREVREECGIESHSHRILYSFCPMNGITNQVFHVVRCRAGAPAGEIDANEIAEVRWFSRAEVLDMLRRGEIRDGFSLAGLLLALGGLGGVSQQGI